MTISHRSFPLSCPPTRPLQGTVTQLQADIAALAAGGAAGKQGLAALRQELDQAQAQARDHALDAESVRVHNGELQEQLASARSKQAALKSEVDAARRDRQERDNEVVMMAAKLQALHDKAQQQQASEHRTAELSERIDVLKVRLLTRPLSI